MGLTGLPPLFTLPEFSLVESDDLISEIAATPVRTCACA